MALNRLVIAGNQGGTNIGESLWRAARQLGLETHFLNSKRAFSGVTWMDKLHWKLRDSRPTHLRRFGKEVVEIFKEQAPCSLLSTGMAPLEKEALKTLGGIGVKRMNYLTDNPWNPACRPRWFLEALRHYDYVFSTRRSILTDLKNHGCQTVLYVPFGYDPLFFYPRTSEAAEEIAPLSSDILFAGGSDKDRIPYMTALIQAGFRLALYGDYWNRHPLTWTVVRGYANPQELRLAILGAKVALCLVRRANRDGHSMRSFEIPAVGACMLTEDTLEHREIFGEEGKAVVYFRTIPEMIEKLRWLLAHEEERCRLAQAVHALIARGKHTYADRLTAMLGLSRDA